MQIQSAEALIRALRESGLFSPDRLFALAAELARLGDDPPALMRHLVRHNHVTLYQLRKVVYGKAGELFLGPYVITDKLGEGGMGKVYRARDTRGGGEVALKVVRSNLLANPVVRGRYGREVRAAAALSHPNIVRLLDADEADGRYYMAMEFVDGVDLARLVRTEGVLPVAEACEYVRQAALGLQHAHQQGFVHRDLKPSNIVVSGERHIPGAEGPAAVKLLDLGLVRSVGFDEGGVGEDLTRAGTVVGTPDYMAPEQAKNSSTVDHRADLYSLGCTFYFLLTGKPPFAAGTPVEKIIKHQVDPPPPLQAARPDVPAELARVVTRLMAKDPGERVGSAGELAALLAPLTRYEAGAEAVPVGPLFGLAGPDTPGPDGHPPSSASSMPPLYLPGSSSGSLPVESPPLRMMPPPVGPADRTPRPGQRPVRKPARARDATPARSAVRPSASANPSRPTTAPTRKPARSGGRALLVAAVGGIAVLLAVVLWVVTQR